MDANSNYGSVPTAYPYERDRSVLDRDRLEYELTVRQEPKQARMCGVGADRRPIDPPPIVQLRVIDPHTRQPPSPANPDGEEPDPNHANSFLQNPYYFMFASLAKPDDDTELHWLKDGKTRCTTGSVVSSLYHLKDAENRNEDAGFFVFPDLSVRTEGSYRLKLSLFEVVGNTVRHCKSIYSAAFYVYTAKKFPGMEESTPLSCSLADQGIKIRIRKDIRVRKRPIAALAPPSDGPPNSAEARRSEHDLAEDDAHAQQHAPHSSQSASNNAPSISGSAVVKRPRHGTLTAPLHLVSGPASVSSNDGMSAHTPVPANSISAPSSIALAGLPAWPTPSTLDPMLGVASATPGGVELSAANALQPTSAHTHTHTHAHPTMGGGIGVGVSGQLLSSGGEPSSAGSAPAVGAGTVARRTNAQVLSPSSASSSYPSSSSVAGMYDRVNYDYESASLRSASSSYDHQRSLGANGGAAYESAGGNGSGRGYDTGGTRGGYDGAAGAGRTGFEHAHQHHPRGSYDTRGYESSQAHSRTPYNTHPHAQTHPEVHGHPARAPFNAPYEESQAYQDGQQHQQQHHHPGGYAHPQATSASYAHGSSTNSHPHPPASHHSQQGQYPSPTHSQYPGSAYSGSYARYDVGATTNANMNTNTNVNAPGAGGSGGYYDTPTSSSSPHSHAYYPSGTSGQTQAQPSQVAAPPPLTHAASYASSGSAGSPYEYSGQGQGHGSSSGDYYSQGHGHGHSGRISPGPNVSASTARYTSSGPYSSGALPASAPGWGPSGGGQAHGHGHGQQEMIHLAPLRHGSNGGVGTGSAGSSSSPSSPALPSSSTNGGYPVIQLSRAPFEQDPGRGVGIPGKKSVLSIGSIISDGV